MSDDDGRVFGKLITVRGEMSFEFVWIYVCFGQGEGG